MQLYLWELYVSKTSGFGMGISAFPSLHVAMVVLCALVALEIDQFLAMAGLMIVLIIETGVGVVWLALCHRWLFLNYRHDCFLVGDPPCSSRESW